MALRVLLADESTTIKKVMQLALQDFAVEVKAVHAGVDVIEVAKSFHPDIVFADVLLQKKNGYEVCAELKNDPQLNRLPIVLMWSSFLEIDERLASRCGADERLEKPFDVETLRQLILKLVPGTRSQRLAHFLDFSQNVTAPMKAEMAQNQATKTGLPPAAQTQSQTQTQTQAPKATTQFPQQSSQQPPPQVKRAAPAAPVQSPAQAPPSQNTPTPPTPIRTAHQAQAAAERASNWNMDSFEDINQFSDLVAETMQSSSDDASDSDHQESHEAPHSHSHSDHDGDSSHGELSQFSLEDSDDNDEGFSEFKLSDLSRSNPHAQPQNAQSMNPRSAPQNFAPPQSHNRVTAGGAAAGSESGSGSGSGSGDEAWSHQNLSAFKIDLAPVQIEGEDFALTFNPNDSDIEGTGYTSAPDLQSEHDRPYDPYAPHAAYGNTTELAFEPADHQLDSGLSSHEETDAHEIALELDNQGMDSQEFEQHFEVQPLADAYQPPRQPMPLEFEAPRDSNRGNNRDQVRDQMRDQSRDQSRTSAHPADSRSARQQPAQNIGQQNTRSATRHPAQQAAPRGTKTPSHREPPGHTSGHTPGHISGQSFGHNFDQSSGPRSGVDTPLTEERLEEIIRAQSQEVIEAVVRRLVPDIATQIIQRELARLLDDSPRSE